MLSGFHDHPRKRVVRSQYDTPLLKGISQRFAIKYVYLGLPGPQMQDIAEWSGLIRRIIAFERPSRPPRGAREDFAELQFNLVVSGLPFDVYYGDMETVVIWGRDIEDRPFVQEEMITLYNLDFCDNISSKIEVPPLFEGDGGNTIGKECMRFEALRRLLRLQADLYSKGGDSRFIVLITVREGLDGAAIREWRKADNPQEVRQWLNKALGNKKIPNGAVFVSPDVLKPFVFTCFRSYCAGLNIASHFLPMVRYHGLSGKGTPMAHFAVLCRLSHPRSALPGNLQTVNHFLALSTMRAGNDGLAPEPLALETGAPMPDIMEIAEAFFA